MQGLRIEGFPAPKPWVKRWAKVKEVAMGDWSRIVRFAVVSPMCGFVWC